MSRPHDPFDDGMAPRAPRREGGPYRSRNGLLFGVCRGLADHLEVPVLWVRLAVIAAGFFTGWVPVIIAYVLAALLLRLEPVLPFASDEDAEFYASYTTSRPMAIHRLKRSFENLDRRIQRLEDAVTAKDYDWEQRLKESD